MYKNILQESGLKKGEAEIYDLLLEFGESPAHQLVKKTKYKRGMVYKFLDDLKSKGLITSSTKNKKTYFRAEHPQKILQSIESKELELSSQKQSLEANLPDLITKYRFQDARPAVTYNEGKAGIKKVFEELVKPKSEPVYGCVDLEVSNKGIPEYLVKEIVPKRIKNKVKVVTFFAESPLARSLTKKDATSLRKSVLLDVNKYPIPAEIDVYEDKTILISFAKEQFMAVVIENKDIATSIKSIFKLAFDKSYKKPNN